MNEQTAVSTLASEDEARWRAAWPEALALWSRYTRLKDPIFCFTEEEEVREHLLGSFAMIRLVDHTVVISLRQLRAEGLQAYPVEILAHEIGHHIYTPADLNDYGRLMARMRSALPTLEAWAPMLCNLYEDLLINDRLQRQHALSMAEVFLVLQRKGKDSSALWALYMRIYEQLWGLKKYALAGTLKKGLRLPTLEVDAMLGARLIRAAGQSWLELGGKFGVLCLPYLQADLQSQASSVFSSLLDTTQAARGSEVTGLTEVEDGEQQGIEHPSLDPSLSGLGERPDGAPSDPPPAGTPKRGKGPPRQAGTHRTPEQYRELLRAMGVSLSDHDLTVQYYQQRARSHLIPFPRRKTPQSTDPHPEGLETWEPGEGLEQVDWIGTLQRSPVIIPGLTTQKRLEGEAPGHEPRLEPVDLDLYVDCSGSMPNPQSECSYLTLAGTLLCMSAFRAGARVQATLWSDIGQVITTPGFVRSEQEVLRVLTGYLGGGTAFPINHLRDTYAKRKPTDRRVHILVLSDEGVSTMYTKDSSGRAGEDVVAEALARAGGGGTLLLNLYSPWESFPPLVKAKAQGWKIHSIHSWEELIQVARDFSRQQYGEMRT